MPTLRNEVDIISAVQKKVLEAEEEHVRLNQELDGFERVLEVINKLGKVREVKAQQFEETGPIENLIGESYIRLKQVLADEVYQNESNDIDFYQWVSEIEGDIRAQDPMMLSFDSGSDEDREARSDRTRSFGIRTREGSVSSKSAGTVLDILKSNGNLKVKADAAGDIGSKDDQLFWLTTGAWAFAVIGMMITIGFLTGDFLASQKSVAIQIERTAPAPLQLPVITICNDLPNVPAFADLPSKEFHGLPLFAISAINRSKGPSSSGNATKIFYPQTLPQSKNSPVEDVVVAKDGKGFLQAERGFDVKREQESLYFIRDVGSDQNQYQGSKGFYCFRIGLKDGEKIEPYSFDSSSSLAQPAVQLKVFKLKMLGACRAQSLRTQFSILTAFMSELLLHAENLQERGILDFNGASFSVLQSESILVYKRFGPDAIADFFCNVYFFSGYFYPSADKANIKYRYNKNLNSRWEQTGSGPYYTVFSWQKGAPQLIGPDRRALENDTFSLDGIRVYAEAPENAKISGIVSPASRISILTSSNTVKFIFRRMYIGGKNRYRFQKGVHQMLPPYHSSLTTFKIALDFSTFETEKVLTGPTMSWPEFITDVFEFVGLFTGICIFTLIVAPAHSLV